jgi:hypothetical protein
MSDPHRRRDLVLSWTLGALTPASKGRPRRSPPHWKEIIAAYDARTGSSDAFCAQHGVASASIHYWR